MAGIRSSRQPTAVTEGMADRMPQRRASELAMATMTRSPDRDGLAPELRVVALLDGCAKGVHVDMYHLAQPSRSTQALRPWIGAGDIGSGIGNRVEHGPNQAAISLAPSLCSPRDTIVSAWSGRGRWSWSAISVGAVIQLLTSSGVVRITDMALGWIGATTPFAA